MVRIPICMQLTVTLGVDENDGSRQLLQTNRPVLPRRPMSIYGQILFILAPHGLSKLSTSVIVRLNETVKIYVRS